MTLLHSALTEDYDRWSLTIGLRCPMVHGESKVTYPVVDELLPSGRRKDFNFSSMVLIARKPAVDEGFSTAPEPPLPPRRDRFDIERALTHGWKPRCAGDGPVSTRCQTWFARDAKATSQRA